MELHDSIDEMLPTCANALLGLVLQTLRLRLDLLFELGVHFLLDTLGELSVPEIVVYAINYPEELIMCALLHYATLLEYDDEVCCQWYTNVRDVPASEMVRSLCAINTLVLVPSTNVELIFRISSVSV